MSDKQEKIPWLGKVGSRDEAIELARGCGTIFLTAAALQAIASFFLDEPMLVDIALHAGCGYFIRFKHSRIAAVTALLVATLALIVTVLNRFGRNIGGGNNIALALIAVLAGVGAVEATFKLHGKFSAQAPTKENI